MARKQILLPLDIFFGSRSQSIILYWLFLARGLWISAVDLKLHSDLSYRTASKILDRLSTVTGIVEKHPSAKRLYRLKPSKSLQNSFGVILSYLNPDYRERIRYWDFWLVKKTKNHSIYLRHDYYIQFLIIDRQGKRTRFRIQQSYDRVYSNQKFDYKKIHSIIERYD